MKKMICIVLAVVLLAGCSSGVSQADYDAVVSERDALREALVAQLDLNAAIAQSVDEPANSGDSEDKNVQSQGDRLNPVPLNAPFSGTYERRGNEFGFTIQITEILRGEEAAQLAVSKNQFNTVPEGKDLILFKVNFTLDKSTDPEPFLCSGVQFDYFSGSYAETSTSVSVAGLDKLHAKLYEGAQTEGWLCTTADPDDNSPLTCFMDTVWLCLY